MYPSWQVVQFCLYPKLKMSESAEEEAVQMDMESSTYSQVVFIDVPRSYPLQADVTCSYKLTVGLIPCPKDWIGIYKVDEILFMFSINLAAHTFFTFRNYIILFTLYVIFC